MLKLVEVVDVTAPLDPLREFALRDILGAYPQEPVHRLYGASDLYLAHVRL
jgi:hypothetical protein